MFRPNSGSVNEGSIYPYEYNSLTLSLATCRMRCAVAQRMPSLVTKEHANGRDRDPDAGTAPDLAGTWRRLRLQDRAGRIAGHSAGCIAPAGAAAASGWY